MYSRFNDISMNIRIKCVQYSMHFLLNHPELRKDITETLKLRQHDSEENVRWVLSAFLHSYLIWSLLLNSSSIFPRYEVVMAIVSTAKKDFEVVSDSEDLLEFVKERTLDKKVSAEARQSKQIKPSQMQKGMNFKGWNFYLWYSTVVEYFIERGSTTSSRCLVPRSADVRRKVEIPTSWTHLSGCIFDW